MRKERADRLLLSRGLAGTCQKAQALIMAGLVYAGEKKVEKPGQMLAADQEMTLRETIPYVSRAGMKLAEALDAFGLSVEGKAAADLGSSTGGFTDCLLQRGARKVYAVDVDIRQLDSRLREDPRVVPIEKNARYLSRRDFADTLNAVTSDLSFISVLKVLPAIKDFLGGGLLLSLIKPQFEAGKGQVGKSGVVRDPALHEDVLRRIIGEAGEMGFALRNILKCSLPGQKGNREFFVCWTLRGRPLARSTVEKLIKEAVWNEKN